MNRSNLCNFLDHILEAAEQACSYIEEMYKDHFLADKRTQQAVVMNLFIMGEAATKLMHEYADFLKRHPDVSWSQMKGMRNRLAHGYFAIDLDVVWETVQTALPELLRRFKDIRKDAMHFEKNG